MEHQQLTYHILPQPDDTTCGPTCLHSVYGYYGDHLPLATVIAGVPTLDCGGTLAVHLACHALERGYRATIFTYKLQLFDPTWLNPPAVDLEDKLRKQLLFKEDPRLRSATDGYIRFLELGGDLRFEDLTSALIRRYVGRGNPILAGLSATCLYRTPREYGLHGDYDDIRGEPAGHFVVLCGYDRGDRTVSVADPLLPNPVAATQVYRVGIQRVLNAVLLGVLTYDANLLIIQPSARKSGHGKASPHRR